MAVKSNKSKTPLIKPECAYKRQTGVFCVEFGICPIGYLPDSNVLPGTVNRGNF